MCSPKGMVTNWKRPYDVGKAVFAWEFGVRGICQYPFVRLSVDRNLAPPNHSRSSSMHGIEYVLKWEMVLT